MSASTSAVFADNSDLPESELEDITPEAREAARWTNEQIDKLIGIIKQHGTRENDVVSIKFKTLFEETAQVFDALSGICKTSKKYKVIDFHTGGDDDQLWQGRHDEVDIVLLKEDFSGVKIARRPKSALVGISSKTKSTGFGAVTATGANKCHVCTKTVYPMEYIGASDKAFHKSCFRCNTCNKMLSQSDYAVASDRNFRCTAHHKEFELTHF